MKSPSLLVAAGIVFSLTAAALCQPESPRTMRAPIVSRVMGTLVKVDGSNLIVRKLGAGREEVTVPTDDKTKFSVDFGPGKLADLKPGMRVSIIAEPAWPTKPARLMVMATSRGLTGTVVKVDGKNVVLRVRQPGGEPTEMTVATNEKTKVLVAGIRLGGVFYPGKTIKLEDLRPDMRLEVLPGAEAPKTIMVGPLLDGRPIPLLTPMPAAVYGPLAKVDGKDLVINARQRGKEPKETLVTTDNKTEFLVNAEPGKLTDLKPGMTVSVNPIPDTLTRPARVVVMGTSKYLSGRFVRLDSKGIVLTVRQAGGASKEVVVPTDEKTRVFMLGMTGGESYYTPRAGKTEDLKPGMRIQVLPETGTASKIIARPAPRAIPRRAARPRQPDGS